MIVSISSVFIHTRTSIVQQSCIISNVIPDILLVQLSDKMMNHIHCAMVNLAQCQKEILGTRYCTKHGILTVMDDCKSHHQNVLNKIYTRLSELSKANPTDKHQGSNFVARSFKTIEEGVKYWMRQKGFTAIRNAVIYTDGFFTG